ncbi:MAG TPA: histidinol dehydrogenase [Alicyclobacillus sp.]|nr:histidinol dehydrogenase [Alicyclobacillus sp.]
MRIQYWKLLSKEEQSSMFVRGEREHPELVPKVKEIVDAVRTDGDDALVRFEQVFDGVSISASEIRVRPEEIERATEQLSSEIRKALDEAINRVRAFHQRQLPPSLWIEEFPGGMRLGEVTNPIESVGLYVPRGKGSFPSVLVMLGVPATVAGVPHIAVATPPDSKGHVDPATLYVAGRIGIETIYKMGGAQAIAALAYGTKSVRPVAKILGPGGPFVAIAKELVGGVVDTGLRSGPSEALVLADEQADPLLVALDLCNEAEHGNDSSVYLVTTSPSLTQRVAEHVDRIVAELPEQRKRFASSVLHERCGALVFDDIDTALGFINDYAVEHLVLHVAAPYELLPRLRYAGEIIIGPNTPISACNYVCGPNAVLPTGGFAKSMSALSTRDFLRTASIVELSPDGLNLAKGIVQNLADYEGFPAHAKAVTERSPVLLPVPQDGLTWLERGIQAVTVNRKTRESSVTVRVWEGPRDLDLKNGIRTPLEFLNHMLETIAWRSGLNLSVSVRMDGFQLMHVVAEDVGITFGVAFRELVHQRLSAGVEGSGSAIGIIDEAQSSAAISMEERAMYNIRRHGVSVQEHVEDMLVADLENFFSGFCQGARATVHLTLLQGQDPHHIWEATFRAFGEALRRCLSPNPYRAGTTPGVKGI